MDNSGKPDIVCISVLDWNHPTISTVQGNIMRRLAAAGQRIFYVNQPLRWLTDYKLVRQDEWRRNKLTEWRKGFVEIEPNFYSFTPPPLIPLNRFRDGKTYRAVLTLNCSIFRKALKEALKPFKVQYPILWNSLDPELAEATLGYFHETLSVYHCIDELAGFKNLSSNLLELEKRTIARSDILITTSEKLHETKSVYNRQAYMLPNAADIPLFKQALAPLPVPAELEKIPHPRFGFVGQLEQRFNFEMVYEAALARPEWHFVIIGPIQPGYGENPPLLKQPNVHTLGPRPSQVLPQYLREMDVCLIPYKLDRLTEAIYPLKLHEYLAAGKPVLAGPLPSLYQFTEVVELVNSPAEFVAGGERALLTKADPAQIAARVAIAEKNSWEERIVTLNYILDSHLSARASEESDAVYTGRSGWELSLQPTDQ